MAGPGLPRVQLAALGLGRLGRGLDIFPGEQGSYPSTGLGGIFTFDDRVLFSARNEAGYELWSSDGTAGGTQMVKNISAPIASSNPTGLTTVGDQLFFIAAANDTRQLWVSDGSNQGTVPLAAELPASAETLVAGSSKIFFPCTHPTYGGQPCVSDGTPQGTEMLTDLGPIASSYVFATAGDLTYFVGYRADQQRLWRSDGTAAGTELVTDFNPSWICDGSWEGCVSYPQGLTPVGETLFLVARTDLSWQLWRTDGSEESTVLISEKDQWYPPTELVAVDGVLYYLTGPGSYFDQAWAIWLCAADATESTLLWFSHGGEPRELTAMGDRLLIIVHQESGDQLRQVRGQDWVQVADWRVDGNPGYVSQLTVVGDRVFFSVSTELTGPELWVSSGTPDLDDTRLVKDIVAGRSGSYPEELVAYGNLLLFSADDGISGRELWISDGTEDGTYRVADIETGITASSPSEMTRVGGLVLFSADAGSFGREL